METTILSQIGAFTLSMFLAVSWIGASGTGGHTDTRDLVASTHATGADEIAILL